MDDGGREQSHGRSAEDDGLKNGGGGVGSDPLAFAFRYSVVARDEPIELLHPVVCQNSIDEKQSGVG